MKFFTYVVCWDSVHENVLEIEKQFKEHHYPYVVINSGARTSEGWHNVGDIRYYRQLYYALQNFDNNYDYMAFICGDVSYWNWGEFLNRATSVFKSYQNIGLYAPHLTNEPWSENNTRIGTLPVDDKLLFAAQTDGIAVIMHRSIVQRLLDYFKYLEQKTDIASLTSGWGMDMIWCSIAIATKQIILRDNAHILNHPAGSSYDHSKASAELKIVLDTFYEFVKDLGLNPDTFGSLHTKMYGRMSQDSNCMSLENFYDVVPKIYKNINTIDYHIIHINDERILNRNEIDKVLNGTKHKIDCLNAREDVGLIDFKNKNPEFKFNWEGFKVGEIGNFGSHYMAWKYLKNSNLDHLLIFEDDVIIENNFVEKYNIAMNNVPDDFDILSIYVDENQYSRFDSSQYISYYISKGYQDWSTLCYVISKRGAEKLCKYIEEVGMDHPTDWFIFRKGHQGIFNVYTLPPYFKSPLEIDKKYESQVQ